MTTPAALVQRIFPALDERAWIVLFAIAGFAAATLKEMTIPGPLLVLVTLGGLGWWFATGQLSAELPFYGLVAYLPFSRQLGGGIGPLTPTVLLLVAAGVLAMRHATSADQPLFELQPFTWVLAWFAGFGVLSWVLTGWHYGAWYAAEELRPLLRWLLPIGCCFLTLCVVRNQRALKTALALLALAVIVVALMALWEYADRAGDSFDRSRVRGITDHPNILGGFFVSYMLLFLAGFLSAPWRPIGWGWLAAFLLCARAVMTTFSRGAYLACVAGTLVAGWSRRALLFLGIVVLGVVVVTRPNVIPAGIRYRMGMTFTATGGEFSSRGDITEHLETSAGARVEIWRGALRMIAEHPWRGVGFGAFQRFLPNVTQGRLVDLDAHNSFLMIAAELGLPALAAFLAALGMVMWQAGWLWRHAQDGVFRAMGIGVLAGAVALVVANSFTVCLWAPEAASYFWVLSGLVMRAAALERGAHETRERAVNVEEGRPYDLGVTETGMERAA